MTGLRHDVTRTAAWVDAGDALLARLVGELTDADLDAAALLDGWTRRHVLAHLARNAEALRRLLAWARTGIVTPMYVDAAQRASEIQSSAGADPRQLRGDLARTTTELRDDIATMPAVHWSATVRSARGRDIPAAEVPWMRAREVWLHAIDLGAGASIADLPADFSLTLIDDVAGFFAAAPGAPAVRLASGDHAWSIGAGAESAPVVHGEPHDLAAWLTGRSTGVGLVADELPKLPAWL